ncbi:hypothetical protein ONZ51_g5234 [Trametes cubensis]|uniref:Uncharacterized protein n=1 Tax=Trametes cubensis TaxID=1111947 RepID=A0AAD7XBA9_9APHY|nr:hypothetical protein ONZ51_g5234 [Trametes cubensis]
MCFTIVSYTDWWCGYRQHTGRHKVDCNKWGCRLSDAHGDREDVHDCQAQCTGSTLEDQHIIMERRHDVCGECREAGRGRREHPSASTNGANGANGHIKYRHLAIPGERLDDFDP